MKANARSNLRNHSRPHLEEIDMRLKSLMGWSWAIIASWFAMTAWAEKPVAPDAITGVNRVDAEQAIQLILDQPQLLVIDVRRMEEFEKGHIEGAINLLDTTLTPELLEQQAESLDRPLLFYCNGVRCLRSSNASRMAHDWGYRQIYWFRGGWNEWRDKQYPVSR